jgi:hypothetical protein
MAQTILTAEIEYNPDVTDPERLAAAMECLLETALSTPGILDGYGNLRVGQFRVAAEGQEAYLLQIDGHLFRQQRRLLMKFLHGVLRGIAYVPADGDRDLLEGLVALTDEVADQAHDWHGIDCLEPEAVCDCERPGYFCSGIPGILARMENGRLARGAEVNRCDLCQRYPSDQAALEKLQELGHGPP